MNCAGRFLFALLGLVPLTAQATQYGDIIAFQQAFPDALVESFDMLPVGTQIEVAPCLGIRFENPGDGFPEVIAGLGSVPSSPPNSLANRPVNVTSTQPVRFSRVDGALIRAVGFYNPTSDDLLILSLLDADGNELESIFVPPQPAPQFRGISSPVGGTTVEIRWDGSTGNGLHGLDDLHLVIDGAGVPDADGDGVPDDLDNCSLISNASQLDADGDDFGNLCDADFNNDCAVDFTDLGVIRQAFFGTDPLVDLNSDGVVNALDLATMKQLFFETPGPSCPGVCASVGN